MDPTNSLLGKILQDEISPVVMVVTTPLAEQACRKNGLSFVKMLSPFSHFHNIDIPVRTASDQPYRLQSFRLRMVYASDVRQEDPQMAVKHLKEVLSHASEDPLFDLQSDPPKLEDLLSMSETEAHPSWFHTFNRDLSQAVSFSDHEAFDHPVAYLAVISSEDEKPLEKFANPLGADQLPSPLKEGAMDPNVLKHCLLLHDKQDGSIEKATGTFTEMRSTFGLNNCRMLSINSNKVDAVEPKENPWAHCETDSSSQDVACFLSMTDLNEIKELMQDLSSKTIIPYMEQKIRVLNQQVAATRKGFRNQIKNLWWRKGKEDALDTPDGPVYTSSSTESQIRVLGDYAFMLRDYELALSNYRLLSIDYKLDKAWKRYAGVQEMMALSLFMLDQSRKDAEYFMETAFSTYLKISYSGSKNATRCGLWWAEMLKARGQHKEAAGILFRISQEEPSLLAAVLLEQASYCYLLCRPPMLHKYGFHLILAGNHYFASDQRKHAIHAYKSALSVYKENSWSYISDHVHFNIGRWYAFLEMFDAAVQHMLEILECAHQSLATQDLFLNDFLHVVENMGRKLDVAKLQLPSINMSSLKVIFEDHRIYTSSAALDVRESLWQSLEENMVPPATAVKSNWLESRKCHGPRKDNDGCVSLVGEAIRVFFEVKNPLQIRLSLSDVSLVCELSTKPAIETDKFVSENECLNNMSHGESSGTRDQSNGISSFKLSEINFILEGGEMKEVQLDVTPKIEGFLKIVGVKWTLSGCVVGYHNFDVDSKMKYKKGKGLQSSPGNNLAFIVIKGLPKLEGNIQQMPKKTYNGNVQPLTLELRNQSEYSVKNMKMKISHPRFLIPGSPGIPSLEFPACLEKQNKLEEGNRQTNSLEKPGDLFFSFPTDTRIHGGEVFQWPLWLHTSESGKIFLYISIYYEMDDYSCDMNYRTLRMYYELEVLPSLSVAISITPCPSKMQEFLVRMEIGSSAISESFWLHQLSSVGWKWEISPLPARDVCPSKLLLAGQELVCFFKLKDRGEMSTESKLTFQGSDMQLGSHGDKELVLDVSKAPLADFHHHERSHQKRLHQVAPSTVDFILVSQLVENDTKPEQVPQIQLLSHHACHNGIICECPVWWLMDGPRTICHDFSTPFCEASFCMTVHNCSDVAVSVKIATLSPITYVPGQFSDASHRFDASGWYDLSLANDVKIASVSSGMQVGNQAPQSITPFIWCASSSTRMELQPTSTAEIPLRICLFSPGVYDLSDYELHWSMKLFDATESTKAVMWKPSGVMRGHPFFLTVLNSDSTTASAVKV